MGNPSPHGDDDRRLSFDKVQGYRRGAGLLVIIGSHDGTTLGQQQITQQINTRITADKMSPFSNQKVVLCYHLRLMDISALEPLYYVFEIDFRVIFMNFPEF